MSYQPPSQPFPPSPPPAPAVSSSAGKRRTPLLILGLLVLAAGLIGGLLVLMSGGSKADEAVKKLARVPLGCTTTLNVEKSGTFNIYLETAGRLPEYDGNCAAGGKYQSSDAVEVDTVVTDADGNEMEIATASGESYDAAGFKGERVGAVTFDKAGTYRINVTSTSAKDDEAAVAVGIDSSSPSKVKSKDQMAGIGLLAGGAVLGLPLILMGLRRRPAATGGQATPPTASVAQPYQPPMGYQQPPTTYQPPQPRYPQPGQHQPQPNYLPPQPSPRPGLPGWGEPDWDRSGDDRRMPPPGSSAY